MIVVLHEEKKLFMQITREMENEKYVLNLYFMLQFFVCLLFRETSGRLSRKINHCNDMNCSKTNSINPILTTILFFYDSMKIYIYNFKLYVYKIITTILITIMEYPL